MNSGKFESEKEEAEYRDRIDTTTLDDLEEVELEYEPGIPDIIVKSVNRFTIGSEEAEKLSHK